MSFILNKFIVPENGEKITSIVISDFKSLSSLKNIEECLIACPNVNRLEISLYDFQIQKEELKLSMGEIISIIANFGKNIEYLHLQSPLIIDNDLIYVSNDNFPKLIKLAIPHSKKVKAKGIKYVSSQSPKLISLNLNYSLYNETDEAAFYIGKYLKKLKRLYMHRTCNLSDSGLISIAEGCRNLEIIEVGRNYDLTDEALEKISKNCIELTSLGMYYNKKITEKGLKYIVKGCPKFKKFSDGNGGGAIPALKEIKSKYPNINFS